jgi:putative tryptophan/tyrosine transport system substrate-binding protein
MKPYTVACIIVMIVLIGSVSTVFYHKSLTAPSDQTTKALTPTARHVNIAIFEPALHPAIKEIEQGFLDTITSEHQPTYHIYNAQGNKTILRAQAEEIIAGSYDLIFTIGAGCSQIIKEISTKRKLYAPIVFTAIDDLSVLELNNLSHKQITGVLTQQDYKEQLSILFNLIPTVKNILLVYDPTHATGLEKDKKMIERIAAQHGRALTVVPVYTAAEITQKVPAFLPDTDIVLILKDNTIVAAIGSLIKLCNQYKKPLYASDLNSADKGASLAFGIYEYNSGVAAAQKAVDILYKKIPVFNVPITTVCSEKIKLNTVAAKQQQLTLNPLIHYIFEHGLVTSDIK